MIRHTALVMLLVVLAAACGSQGTEAVTDQASPALEGDYTTLDGATIDLADLRGNDVVLWFWAPW